MTKRARKPRPARKAARPILHPGQIFCPVGRAMDVIGDRWTLVLVRHLLNGPCGFQELRVRTGIAPRVLSSKLRRLTSAGLVEVARDQPRPLYHATERGRALEPIIASIARWYLRNGLDDLQVDANRFSATSAQSVLESLPFMVREERAVDADVTFEVRLSGLGGGVWTVRIANGACTVRQGFAERADVRYTADARVWCGVALGIADARETVHRGLMSKDGGREAMDYYFYQINRAAKPSAAPHEASGADGVTPQAEAARPRRRQAAGGAGSESGKGAER